MTQRTKIEIMERRLVILTRKLRTRPDPNGTLAREYQKLKRELAAVRIQSKVNEQ